MLLLCLLLLLLLLLCLLLCLLLLLLLLSRLLSLLLLQMRRQKRKCTAWCCAIGCAVCCARLDEGRGQGDALRQVALVREDISLLDCVGILGGIGCCWWIWIGAVLGLLLCWSLLGLPGSIHRRQKEIDD
jgi:hypothetical protein